MSCASKPIFCFLLSSFFIFWLLPSIFNSLESSANRSIFVLKGDRIYVDFRKRASPLKLNNKSILPIPISHYLLKAGVVYHKLLLPLVVTEESELLFVRLLQRHNHLLKSFLFSP
ncbi:MAG: hypothetical protein CM15mP83_2450 [Flavobacteriaceae bacterium]|nr:MAG: hypothetical protein CM15mP83_2450 [Flavobacteriaceae bacterium]